MSEVEEGILCEAERVVDVVERGAGVRTVLFAGAMRPAGGRDAADDLGCLGFGVML